MDQIFNLIYNLKLAQFLVDFGPLFVPAHSETLPIETL
jgi:hypothetical protein